MSNDPLTEMFADRIDAPVDDSELTPILTSPRFRDAFARWVTTDATPDISVGGYTVAMLIRDFGVPTFSAMLLLASLEADTDRLLPRLEGSYAGLRDSPYRPVIADPHAINLRVVQDVGVYSDGGMIG